MARCYSCFRMPFLMRPCSKTFFGTHPSGSLVSARAQNENPGDTNSTCVSCIAEAYCYLICIISSPSQARSTPHIQTAVQTPRRVVSHTNRGPARHADGGRTSYAGFDADQWRGAVAPAGTSAAVVAKLNAQINQSLGSADMKARLLS